MHADITQVNKVGRQAGRYGGGDRRDRIWQNTYYKFLSGKSRK